MKRTILILLFLLPLGARTQQQNFPGGGGVSPNSPIPANQAQGPTFNVVNYGAKGDAQHIRDGVTLGGATKTVTSATANFQVSDVGKFIACAGNGATTVSVGTTITARNSATSVSISQNDNGAATSVQCVWYTQDDTSKFVAANTAANSALASIDPNIGTTLGNNGSIYCPEGGYAVSGRIYASFGSGSNIIPNFIGAGKQQCIIYVLPTTVDPGDGGAVLMNPASAIGTTFRGFSVDGLGKAFVFSHPLIWIQGIQQFTFDDIKISNINAGGANNGTLDFRNSSNGVSRNVFVQGAATAGQGASTDFACSFVGTVSSKFTNLTCSNHNQTAKFGSSGGQFRGVSGDNAPVFENPLFDECGAAASDCTIFTAGYANIIGGWIGTGNTGRSAMNVDGTSKVWMSNVNCGQFGSTNVVSNCMTLASGAEVNVTMSDLRGNGSGANGVVVTGPAGAIFNDIGGNKYENCVSAVCTPITAATYATQGFTGGIVPKATVTHTPNTCYAVTGNLLATAQNICTFLNDQNYQLLNITAQSGGTTPANSACATPPVITFSDGTRTATLTMTTAKTQWSSAVDAVTNLNQVFATGTTLTVSIGANTCATPPVNVAVSYVLQSVLNP